MTITGKERIIWLASFFDGEGCITFSRRKHINKKGELKIYRGVQISVAQVDPEPIKMFYETFGCGYRNHWLNKNNRIQFEWRATGKKAATILNILLPYLVVKREQAYLVIEYYALKFRQKKSLVNDYVSRVTQLKHKIYPVN